MPGMTQDDEHGPHHPALSRLGVGNQAQSPEVRLGHLSRRGVLHPHRGPAGSVPVALDDDSPYRLIGLRWTLEFRQTAQRMIRWSAFPR